MFRIPIKKLLKQILVSKHDVSNQRSVLIFCIVIIFQSYHYINMSVISVRKKLVTLRVFNTVLFNYTNWFHCIFLYASIRLLSKSRFEVICNERNCCQHEVNHHHFRYSIVVIVLVQIVRYALISLMPLIYCHQIMFGEFVSNH